MTRFLGERSLKNLQGVHPDLTKVVRRALEIGPIDFTVIEGVRSPARQRELYGQGRTTVEMAAKGLEPALAKPNMPKVTWTLKSNHFVHDDGFGHAVDVVHIVGGQAVWADCEKIAPAMRQASRELGIPLRWGADWNSNGKPREKGETDSPHWELAR